MHVRAMFRVLSISRNHEKRTIIHLGATYATRDGIPTEENKSFSKWTPSGECDLIMEPAGPFIEGGYVYLDFYPAEAAPEPPAGAVRTSWEVLRFEVDIGSAQFTTRMYPVQGVHQRGSLWMTVTNISPACVELFALAPGGPSRKLTVDFSAVP